MRLPLAAALVAVMMFPAAGLAQGPGPRAAQLRGMIEDRFAERLATELDLDETKTAQVRDVLLNWAGKRRQMEREEQQVRQRLGAAMRPGVAADDREVNRLIDELMAGRVAYVQSFRDELNDLAPVLTPVQRAQYVLLRDRLMQRVQEVRNQRNQMEPGRRRPPL